MVERNAELNVNGDLGKQTHKSPEKTLYNIEIDDEASTDLQDLKESLQGVLRDCKRGISNIEQEDEFQNASLEDLAYTSPSKKSKTEDTNMSRLGSIKEKMSRSMSPIKSSSRLIDNHLESGDLNMSSLVEELRAARTLNRSLTEKLAQAESDFQAARKSKEDVQVEMEAKVAARGAALVDKLYTAQKERDAAILARLKMANEERDEALERLKRIEKDKGFDSGVESGSLLDDDIDMLNYDEMSVNELLRKVESSEHGRIIEKHGNAIADRLARVQRSNKRKLINDDGRIAKERDDARAQVKQLEDTIENMKREREEFEERCRHNEKTHLKACQAQLKTVAGERDTAENLAKQLKEELQNARVYYSLHKSLSQEHTLRDQFNTTMDNFEEKIKLKEQELQVAQRSYDEVVAKLNAAIREKTVMASQLQDNLRQLAEEKSKSDRLQRLVGVLRKRITGASQSGTI
eukprot:gene17321-19054_t